MTDAGGGAPRASESEEVEEGDTKKRPRAEESGKEGGAAATMDPPREKRARGCKSGPMAAQARLLRELKQCEQTGKENGIALKLGGANEDDMKQVIAHFDFDPDTKLQNGQPLDKRLVEEGVDLEVQIPDDYPLAPPFVRVLSPTLSGGFVLSGGALCMDILSNNEWVPAYTLEKTLISIRALMIDGNVRVSGSAKIDLGEAKRSFAYAMRSHHWDKPSTGRK